MILGDYAVPETIEEHVIESDESGQEEVATPKRNRKSFHNRFNQWANGHGAETMSKLRWAIPTNQIAVQRITGLAPFHRNCRDDRILAALTSHGVPRLGTTTPSWGNDRPSWFNARRMFYIECACPTLATGPTTNKLDRCHRCRGYKIKGTIPDVATCRQCRKPASTVCAVCLAGVHRFGGYMIGHCANRAYDQLFMEMCRIY